MKKILLAFSVCTGCFIGIFADITSGLFSYQKIEVSISQTSRPEKKHHKKKKKTQQRTSPPPTPHSNIIIDRGFSTNWSGYVSMTDINNPVPGNVTNVAGTWTVPKLLATPETSYTAIWVGIDGYLDSTVEQIGTEHVWIDGAQQNIVWYEMYPNPAYQIDFPISTGDIIEAEVEYTGGNQFVLSIVNHTKNLYTQIPEDLTQSSSAQRKCAEWIVEAPYSSGILPLADFQTVSFTNCTTVIKGIRGAIADLHWETDDLTMITSDGSTIKATASHLSSDYTAFTVTRHHQ